VKLALLIIVCCAAEPAAFVADYWQLGGYIGVAYALAIVLSAATAGAVIAHSLRG